MFWFSLLLIIQLFGATNFPLKNEKKKKPNFSGEEYFYFLGGIWFLSPTKTDIEGEQNSLAAQTHPNDIAGANPNWHES